MKFIKPFEIFLKTFRFNIYFGLAIVLSSLSYFWINNDSSSALTLVSSFNLKNIYISIAMASFILGVSVTYYKMSKAQINSPPKRQTLLNGLSTFRRQTIYILHWGGIIFFNLMGFIFFYNDILMMSRWMSITLLLTSAINSFPHFWDDLEMRYQIHEAWQLEDLIYFRGHFSKNRPRAGRNPIHAAWPILLCGTLSVAGYSLIAESNKKISVATLVQEVGRKPAQYSPDSAGSQNMDISALQVLKGVLFLSLGAAGLFVMYNHSLRSDYAKKWEILNKHQREILNLYSTKDQNVKSIKMNELQFAVDLIETNMWGHRSFIKMFESIISTHNIHETTGHNLGFKRKDLLQKLYSALSTTAKLKN